MPLFHTRKIESRADWLDPDGIKIYTISAANQPVDRQAYTARLNVLKGEKRVAWSITPAFVICHDGANARYLILAWWGNDNELFISVSAETASGWVEDSSRYAVCLWDLEVIWHERNVFVDTMYCPTPKLDAYRERRITSD
ncbi:hypothetical protein [Dyella humicola]|uniref:hypothetical protein n=1 Tax=Dyella humicola TaxID=2992126 RepID=UPI00225B275E|nr:hypothetical protein [Dyella humicola]